MTLEPGAPLELEAHTPPAEEISEISTRPCPAPRQKVNKAAFTSTVFMEPESEDSNGKFLAAASYNSDG